MELEDRKLRVEDAKNATFAAVEVSLGSRWVTSRVMAASVPCLLAQLQNQGNTESRI